MCAWMSLCTAHYCRLTTSGGLCFVTVNRVHWWYRGLAWEWRVSARRPVLYFWSLSNSCSLNSDPCSSKHSAVDKLRLSTSSRNPHLTSTVLLIFLLAESSYSMENNRTFLYFAYGSNLLKERLQLKNPSATVHCVARLKVKSNMQ